MNTERVTYWLIFDLCECYTGWISASRRVLFQESTWIWIFMFKPKQKFSSGLQEIQNWCSKASKRRYYLEGIPRVPSQHPLKARRADPPLLDLEAEGGSTHSIQQRSVRWWKQPALGTSGIRFYLFIHAAKYRSITWNSHIQSSLYMSGYMARYLRAQS